MKQAIVIGSGAGGATVARELQGTFNVTILEAGKEFHPLKLKFSSLENLRKFGLFFDERQIQLLFPAMQIRKTDERMVLVNGIATGGTTSICTGNALRMDQDLKKIGVHLDDEFEELYKDIPISTAHKKRWRPMTKRLFEIFKNMGLDPQPSAKMGNYEFCMHCGRCVMGCPNNVKWDSRRFINDAMSQGAKIVTNCHVREIIIEHGRAVGVKVKSGLSRQFFAADLIILAAGGFGTPVILQNSGILCVPRLFVDPVLCVSAEWHDALQNHEVSMPFIVQHEHFILSPYFDYLSFFFNKSWRIPAGNIVSLMIKLGDTNEGSIANNKVNKTLTVWDKQQLQYGVEICSDVLLQLGVGKKDIFLGTINAGHPGGMLPLTELEAASFHHSALPENVYIADATLLPKSLGNPPILTIMAMAKRVSKLIRETDNI